ncbi:hypothetical protein [Teredinibacter sp. KSP-S5-2]|uniref:hypothetical protein n=1 Tax=Teredinibacter sp. KSP-S5-2 TaxID=3034506 RepID=UPI0029347AA4|nr:hypothetical protein [Teredinibacter sp. KSP-S5-2]WNO10500.1 hypothetical protein P5V12_04875 [Teredinibacter sp. KSP-S5-2]
MTTLDDVYRKFGEVSEAAQLLETELGTILIEASAIEAGLIKSPDPEKATEIYKKIDRNTLGQLIKKLGKKTEDIGCVEELLNMALATRNRLAHSFYMQHNLRRNSVDGRKVMIDDLEGMHDQLLDAYKALMLTQGIDLEKLAVEQKDGDPSEGD